MKQTKEKDALALTYQQLGEIMERIHPLIHRGGVDKKDVHTIAAMIRNIYGQLKHPKQKPPQEVKNETLKI